MDAKDLMADAEADAAAEAEAEETMVAGFLDRLTKIVNDYARKTAKRAINKIGRN